jgi:hypothetical protein
VFKGPIYSDGTSIRLSVLESEVTMPAETIVLSGKEIKAFRLQPGECPDPVEVMEEPIFLAFWGSSFCNAGQYLVTAEQFTARYCYTEEDVSAITALKVGETWTDRHYGDQHTVERIR